MLPIALSSLVSVSDPDGDVFRQGHTCRDLHGLGGADGHGTRGTTALEAFTCGGEVDNLNALDPRLKGCYCFSFGFSCLARVVRTDAL